MPIRQLRSRSSQEPSGTFRTRRIEPSPSVPSRTRIARPIKRNSVRNDWLRASQALPTQRASSRSAHSTLKKRLLRFALRFGLIAFFIGSIGIISLFAIYSRDLPDPNKIIDRDLAQSTRIYDRTGEKLLYEIHGTERRTLIELSNIPQYAIDATIAIEDKNFFNHGGLSIPHVAKAVVLEVLSKLGLYRGLVPGGSTLTQQFIKNAVLTTEKSYERKIKELVLANRIEKKFTKEEILKLYFNEIPYGSTAYGIETAAHIYFDTSAKDLSLAQAAVLAALPQAPSYYSPYGSHKDELIGRQQYVLDLMVEQGYITEDQADAAKQEELVFKRKREDIKAPHFVFMVKEQLAERYGERLVEQGGLKIITTLDADMQKTAESIIEERAQQNLEQYDAQNAALVSIDVRSGEVLALIGSRDYFDDDIDGQVNVATSLRQPGSSLKPIIYAEAFNQGYRPETTVFDLVTSFAASGKDYKPHNYDAKEHGPVTLRTALQGSLNIPAVKMLYLVGVRRAVELAQELGYTSLTDPDRYGLSLVLGGGEVRLIEHTNAYASFAREGVFKPYVTVLRVEEANGNVLEEHTKSEERRVLDRNVVRTLNNVLSDNAARSYIFGENNYLTLPGRPVAAKTGTTNDYRDAWTIGYTPSIATGVWVGNSSNEEMKRGADGSVLAAPIWQKFMSSILNASPVEGFKAPDEPEPCSKPMVCGDWGTQLVKINSETGKLAGPYTPPSKIKEVAFREAHSILHYIEKSDPLGPIPENPTNDPQYALWEEPIRTWAEENGYTNQRPPTETDDIYKPEDKPVISWVSPSGNALISNSTTQLSVDVQARRGVRRVEYYLNNIRIGSSESSPFTSSLTVSPITPNGAYNLRATAFDDLGNESTASIPIVIDVERSQNDWSLIWSVPAAGASYTPDQLPDTLNLSIQHYEQIKKIDFYYTKAGAQTFIGYREVAGPSISIDWEKPSTPGQYVLSIIITDVYNNTFNYPDVPFQVFAANQD